MLEDDPVDTVVKQRLYLAATVEKPYVSFWKRGIQCRSSGLTDIEVGVR